MAGFVYIMSNPSMVGRIKIGQTSKDPKANRLRELSADTAAAEPFHLEYYCYVEEYEKLEALVHAELAHARPNKNREFFIIPTFDAMLIIQKLAPKCGGIKFEEASFSERIDEEPFISSKCEHEVVDENNFENHINQNLMELYPKAHKVIEYSDVAKKLYNELQNLSEPVKEEFLNLIETQPSISDDALQDAFERNFSKVYKHPFSLRYDNYLYGLCLQHSREMAEEFFEVKEIRGDAINTSDLFEKLSAKYSIPPSIHELASSKFILSDYLNTAEIDLDSKKLRELLFDVDLEIARYHGYGYVEYALNKAKSVRITDKLMRDQFVNFLKHEFDPLNIKETYIIKPYPDPASKPVKTVQPHSSTTVKGTNASPVEKKNNAKESNSKTKPNDYILLWLFLGLAIILWIIF